MRQRYPNVIAVHVLHLEAPDEDENMARIRERFEREIEEPLAAAGETPPRLVMVPAPYRQIYKPLLDLVAKIDADTPGRSVAIIIPELVLPHWWQRLLLGRRAERLRAALMEHAGPRLMIVTAPWRG